jgi:hypothetical protein
MTLHGGSIPLKQEVPNNLETVEIPTPKPFLVKVNPVPLNAMLGLEDFIVAPIIIASCLIKQFFNRC